MRKTDPALHEERRAQVVKAALACFRRRGFAATTTAEIAREAGMSPGHMFHYFRSKDEIIAAVAEADRAQARAAVARIGEADDLVAALAEAASADTDLGEYAIDGRLGLELQVEALRNPAVAETLKANYRDLQTTLRAAIVRGQGRGAIAADLDPVGAAILITALFEGVERAAATDPELDRHAAGAALHAFLRRLAPTDASPAEAEMVSPVKLRTRRGREDDANG